MTSDIHSAIQLQLKNIIFQVESESSCNDLSSLKDRFRLEILVVSRVPNVGFDPADVLTTTEAPFLQALHM